MRRSSNPRDGSSGICDQSEGNNKLAAGEMTKSASLAKAERQIQALEAENKRLREDFAEISSMYHLLVNENKHERFDERRVMMLKAQIIQLERQVIQLSGALGSRTATLMEIENSLSHVSDILGTHLAEDKATGANVGSTSVPRAELTNIIETTESARIKLYKNIENINAASLHRPLIMLKKFIKPSRAEPVTLLDICSGNLDHLNLKEVGKLEGELAQLYKQLMLVNKSLSSIVLTPNMNKPASREVPVAVYEKLGGEVTRACNLLTSTNVSLLELSLLVPAAPWPPVQRPRYAELTTDDIIKSMPSFPRSKASEGRHMIDSLLKCFMYEKHMHKLQNQILTDELNFHQNVYDLQQDYIQNLFTAVKEGCRQFEENARDILCQPLSAVLSRFSLLKNTSSEDSLREFLSVFRQYASQIEEAVDCLQPEKNEGGSVVLSLFREQFLKSLNELHQGCRQKRDTAINELEEIRNQREVSLGEMKQLFMTTEDKMSNNKQEYENIIKDTSNLNISEYLESTPEEDATNVRPNANGRKKTSVRLPPKLNNSECSCRTEESANPESDNVSESKKKPASRDRTPSRNTAKRPASIGRMGSNLDSSRLSSPKHSKLPTTRSTPDSPGLQSGNDSKSTSTPSVRASLIPGPSTARSPKYSLPSSGRLTPIHRLKLKPITGSGSSETLSSPKSELESEILP